MAANVNQTDKLVFNLRMHQVDYNEQKIKSLRKEIADKYGVPLRNVEVNFIPIKVDENGEQLPLTTDIITSVQDPQFQVGLFREWLKLKEIEDVDFSLIEDIDKRVNAGIDFDSYSKYKSYKFKYAKWSNYCSYGPDNYFDFTKLHGLVLLNSTPENQGGKTTFAIDMLRFALFGRSDKTPTLDKVFNIYTPEVTEVMVECGIEIEGQDYVIRRTVTRPALSKRTAKSKPKQKLEYFRLVNGTYEMMDNCEGENTAETNNIIRESIGSMEDFNLIISATSYTLGDLLRVGQTDRSKMFSRWLGLLTIEKKDEIAGELWKKTVKPSLLSNQYDKATLEAENVNYRTVIEANDKEITTRQTGLNVANENIIKYNAEKTEILKQRKGIKDGVAKLDVSTVNYNLQSAQNELAQKRAIMQQHKTEYMPLKDTPQFNPEELDKVREQITAKQGEVNAILQENAGIKVEIRGLRAEVDRIRGLMEQGKCPTCGHPIDAAEQNGHIDELTKKEKELIAKGTANQKRVTEINEEITKLQSRVKELEELKDKAYRKSNLELKMTAVKSNIDEIKARITLLEKQKAEIAENEDAIRYNNEVDRKAAVVDENIRNENNIKDRLTREIESYNAENRNYEVEIKKRDEIIKKLAEEEKVIRSWNIYRTMVGKDGIVKIVLKRALPVLNNEIARLLNGICDFEVKVSVSDEDNKVRMDLLRDDQVIDLSTGASGFETVASALAIRSALATVSSISHSNSLVLDEILDGVAVSNYENMHKLYQRIIENYDFIIHITHNELITDWHDMQLTVVKEGNISRIEMKDGK